MRRLLIALLLSFGALNALRCQQLLPGGFVDVSEKPLSGSTDAYLRLRGPHSLSVSPDRSGNLEVTIENSLVGKYSDNLEFKLLAQDGTELESGSLAVGNSTTIKKSGLGEGLCTLTVNARLNASIVRVPSGRCLATASKDTPLKMIVHCPKLWFLTHSSPNGRVAIVAAGAPPLEQVALTVWDSEGNVVFEGNTVGKKNNSLTTDIPIPADQAGKLWSLQLSKVPDTGYEDMSIAIVGGAEPMLSHHPDRLAIPLMIQAETLKDGMATYGMRLCPVARKFKDLQVDLTFNSGKIGDIGNRKTASWKSGDPGDIVGFTVDQNDVLYGTFEAKASLGGKLVQTTKFPAAFCKGISFTEIVRKEEEPAAEPSERDKSRGFQVFQRDEPGFVRLHSRPTVKEITDTIPGLACPGTVSTEFVAVLPLRSRKPAKFTLSELVGPGGATIPASRAKLTHLHIWPQRIDWNSRQIIVAPEMMRELETVELHQGIPHQIGIQVDVPANAAPGTYTAVLALDGERVASYELRVTAFKLPEVPGITFGLYPDTQRWKSWNFTDDEVARELQMFRDYGQTALMMYPCAWHVLSWDGSKLSVDWGAFRRYMNLYWKTGFDGVCVISLQQINGHLLRAIGQEKSGYTPDFVKAFNDYLKELDKLAKEDNWGQYCLHTVDEPSGGEAGAEAVRSLKLIKEAGFKTFNTCYGKFVREHLAPYLDYRCYNNIAFGSTRTPEMAVELRSETLAAGAHFWLYGSGCYTNGGIMQDCNIYTNRHMLGVAAWRSKATGLWTWTFMRAKGDIFNDLDGQESREQKDACIAYPSDDRKSIVTTLQWEACREGIYDYRLIKLWDDLARKAAGTKEAETRRKVNGEIESIAWTHHNFAVTNGQLRNFRKFIVAEIETLLGK